MTISLHDEAAVLARTSGPLPVQHLPFRAVRLDVLDAEGRAIPALDDGGRRVGNRVASGFLMLESTGLFLYTCWHVVTGIDPAEPKLPGTRTLPPPARLRIRTQATTNRSEFVQVIGGQTEIEVAIADVSTTPSLPLWEQDSQSQTCSQLEMAGLKLPLFHDLARIQMPEHFSVSDLHLTTRLEIFTGYAPAGTEVFVVGFPYGYSAMASQPTPVVLRRAIAAIPAGVDSGRTFAMQVLLDASGAPGMSGGPVFLVSDGRLQLYGIYTGLIYPDAPREQLDRVTALGTGCQLVMLHQRNPDYFARPRVLPVSGSSPCG